MTEPITAEEWIEEEVPVERGGTLYVDLDRGSVNIESHDRDVVQIVGDARGWSSSMAVFVLEKIGNDVQLDLGIDRWLLPGIFTPIRIEVVARVPRHYNLEIGTSGGSVEARNIGGRVGIDTRGGRISVAQVDGHALLRTSGGRIEASDVQGDVRAKTSGGPIRARRIAGGVEARTSGGPIRIEGVGGEVDAKTSGGNLQVAFAHEPWGRAETSGGSIDVNYPRGVGVNIDARASGGRVKLDRSIHTDGKNGRSKVQAALDGGGAPLRLRTAGGSIRVDLRDPGAPAAFKR